MRVQKTILIFIVLIISNKILLSGNFSDYTSHKIGDTLELIEKPSAEVNGYLYCFVAESNCFICDISLKKLVTYFQEKKNIKIVIFYNSKDENKEDQYRNEIGRNCTYILDRLSTYTNLFKIKKLSFFYLIDKNGKILYQNKIEGSTINDKEISKLLDNSGKQNNKLSQIEEIKRISLFENNMPLLGDKYRRFTFSENDSNFYFNKNRNASIYQSNMQGITKCVFDSSDIKNIGTVDNYDVELEGQDSILHIFDNKRNGLYSVIRFNLQNFYYTATDIFPPTNFAYNFPFSSTKDDKYFFGKRMPTRNTKYFTNNDKTIFVYDKYGKFINSFGNADSLFFNKAISGLFSDFVKIIDNNKILSWQSFTKKIRIYDTSGQLKNVISIRFFNNYHNNEDNIPNKLNDSTWKYIRANYSFNHHIIIDSKSNDKIGLVFYNYKDINPDFPGFVYEQYYFLHLLNLKTMEEKEYSFPVNVIPFYLNEDIIYTAGINDKNELSIIEYKIKE